MRKSTQDYIREALASSGMIADEGPLRAPPVGRSLSADIPHPRYPRQTKSGLKIVQEPQSQGISEAAHNAAISKLIAATGGKVSIRSGKRSTKRQAELYQAAIRKYGSEKAARKWVAPPGRSRHERGLATDLGGDLNLAAKLAGQFGLHFPMAHEPWHAELKGSRKR